MVDLQVLSSEVSVEELTAKYGNRLADDLEVVEMPKTTAIRVQVPEIDMFADFMSQAEKVRKALVAATRLLTLIGGG
jgi:hypothetical protein